MPQIESNLIEFFTRFTALIILIAIALFLVWLVTIIDIVQSDFKTNADKIVWFFFVMMIPPLGILLYCIIGRSQRIETGPAGRSTRYRDIGRE
jgi:choline-glycine betaine transporter